MNYTGGDDSSRAHTAFSDNSDPTPFREDVRGSVSPLGAVPTTLTDFAGIEWFFTVPT